MTEPSQYFKGRTVQEQMDEVIGYVDKRAEEVAAAKADDVLQPVEAAKTAAQAAAEAAEAAKDTTLAALPEIRQDISGLKAEDAALDGRLDTVELKVQTAEGNIVTIQGQIVSLQNAQGEYLKKDGAAQTVTSQIMVPTTATELWDTQIANGTRIQNDLAAYKPMIRNTGNQLMSGIKLGNFYTFVGEPVYSSSDPNLFTSLCDLGVADSDIAIGFCVVSRTNVCMGGMNVSSTGVPTYQGVKVSSANNLSLGIGNVDGHLHLLIKRSTSSGQNISLTIFGITKSRNRIDPPAAGVGTVTATSYNEAVTI